MRTHVTQLVVAFRNFTNAPKNSSTPVGNRKTNALVIQLVPCSQYADYLIPANTLPPSPEMRHRLQSPKFRYSNPSQ